MAKILNPGPSQTVVEFVYDGNQLIEERDGSNNVIASYVYGPGIDEPIAMTRGSDTYYYHQDDLGNVVALTDGNDGATEGDVVERYDYGAFGAPTIYEADGTTPRTASIAENPYLFTGREWNPELNAYWYRTRYYDPTAGRFLSRDTIGLWGDPANLGNPYTYVNNNPWSRIDPYGHEGGFTNWIYDKLDPRWGINSEAYDRYFFEKKRVADKARSEKALQITAGGGAVELQGGNVGAEIPNHAGSGYNTVREFAQEKGLEAADTAIALGTIIVTGPTAVIIDGGRVAIDASDGSIDPLNTGLTALGMAGAFKGPRKAGKKAAEVSKEAAENLAATSGVRIRNVHLAGKVHPVTGIPFDADGFPDFSSVATHTVRIQQTGKRANDFNAANLAAGFDKTPDYYSWHHHQDGATMQLVPRSIHEKTGHTGGFGLP